MGAMLFRIGLVLFGIFLLIGGIKGWWQASHDRITFRLPALDRGTAILLAILVMATLLRLYRLNQGLWYDEIDTLISYARAPFGEIVTTYESQNQHFLYTLLAHTFFISLGESAWTLRLPAVFFGVASIWALYVFARAVTDSNEALLSAALLAFSYHHVWFSQNARGYTGLLFWTILTSWIFMKGVERQGPRTWLAYAGGLVLGVYTHMNMLFVVASHFIIYIWLLFSKRHEPWPNRWAPLFAGFLLSAFLTFLLHAFTIPQILGPALADRSLVETWKNPLWTLREISQGFHLGFGKGIAALIGVGVLGAGGMSYLRQKALVVYFLVLPVIIGSIVTLLLGHPLWPRFFFFALGFLVLIAVRGTMVLGEAVGRICNCPTIRSKQLASVVTIGVIIISACSLPFVYRPKQDFVAARDFVTQAKKQGDAIVAVGAAALVYKNYYAPQWESVDSLEQLDMVRSQSNRTWVLFTLSLHMESYHPDIYRVIQEKFHLIKTFPGSLNGGTIFVYRSNDSVPNPRDLTLNRRVSSDLF
jgi:4-amino-4-deoxy-L-arabinose transferase-like glycosyltransferase